VSCSTTPVVYSCATRRLGAPQGSGSEAPQTAGEIEFTTNYSDPSTGNGFLFEFRCDRCGNGYRTEFDTFELSAATNALDGAGSMLGGIFSQAASVAPRVKSAAWEKASDKAFRKASEEIRPKFVSAPLQRPDVPRGALEREEGPLQAVRAGPRRRDGRRAGGQVRRGGVGARQDGGGGQAPHRGRLARGHHGLLPLVRRTPGYQRQVLRPLRADLKAAKHCTQCGAKLEPGAKFCSGCGSAVA